MIIILIKSTTRYGIISQISEEMPINLITSNQHIVSALTKTTTQNRPFKQIFYRLRTKYSTTYTIVFIQQEIITNHKYLLERKEYINNIRNELYNGKSKSIYSKMDIARIYKIVNHFIHKNRKNSIEGVVL